MGVLITTNSIGSILLQTGRGVPTHIAPIGSQYTDILTANLYYNRDGYYDWQLNIDVSNSGSTSGQTSIYTSGGTYSDATGVATFTNTSGGTFNVSGFFKSSDDIYTTGFTFNPSNYDLILSRNDSSNLSVNLSILTTDMTVTGGTYNMSNGVATFTNNTGGTFNVSGFLTGYTDNDTYLTGGTYNQSTGVATFTNNTGGTFNVSDFNTGYTLTSNGIITALGYTPLSAYTDTYVTGGTYLNGDILFTNSTGGTFNVSGLYTGDTDTYVTGFTYSNNIFTIKQNNNQPDLSVLVTNMTGITTNTIYTDYIDFNTNYTGQTLPAGRLQWDDGNGTLVLGLKGGFSNIELGLENMALCFNAESTTLTAGTIVYVYGSQGNRPSIKRAIATSDGYSVTTLGMVSESIASGAEGFITTFGMVNNLNTVGYSGGTPIWLSPTVAGGFTSVKPQAPYHTVLLGYVVRIHASVGSVFVHISNGWEIDELHDVRINDKSDGDLLMLSGYNGNNVWVNSKTLNGSYTMTGLTVNGDLIVSGGTRSWFSGNSSSDLVRITQIGSGNALVVEDSNNPDVTQFVVDNVGNVGIGTNTPISKLQISNTATTISNALYTSDFITLTAEETAPGVNIISAGNSVGNRGVFKSTRSRGTLNLPTLPQSGDYTFSLLGAVYDGVTNFATAGISYIIDGSITANTAPQRIIFETATGNTRTERMRITSDGKVGIGVTPIATLSVKATAIPSAGENIATFQVSDAAGVLGIQNLTNSDGVFVPSIVGNQASGVNQTALNFTSYIYPVDDTGTNPAMTFRTALNTFTGINTRPLYDFRNWNTSLMLINANGDVGIGTTSPNTKLHVSGNSLVSGNFTATTVSATTYYNLPTDIYVTGGTYSSGTVIFTNSTGGTFNVTGFTSGGTFTGGTVNGATNFTNGLSANTISATTYVNLPKVGFSPINVGVCDTAPTAASTQYYYQTIAEVTTTLSKVKLWGFSGSDLVLFGIYRGSLQGGMTLIGQARKTCGLGPNELTLTAETGQNLSVVAGEDLVVGYYPDGTSWRTVYDVGISDIYFGLTNTTNITTMPATPTGTATAIRFACTLY